MFSKTRIAMFALLLAVLSLLGACTLGGQAEAAATPTEVDVNAVYTQAVETARARLTEMAPVVTNTPEIANTTEVLVEEQSPLVQITITVNPIITPTLGGLNTPIIIGTDTAATPGLSLLTPIPTITPIATTGQGSTGPVCKNSAFEGDMTITDGTVMSPWQKFTKTWRMRNSGTCTWDEGFVFKPWSGPSPMANPEDAYNIRKADKFVPAGTVIDISIDMYAPGEPNEYIAHWKWFDDTGKPFGADFTVVIKVVK